MAIKTKCDYCKKNIDVFASRCPYCQGEYTPEQIAERAKSIKGTWGGCVAIVGIIVLLGLIGQCSGSGSDDPAPETSAPISTQGVVPQAVVAGAEPAAAEESSLTGPQANAVRSATQYLAMSGFSREGLIDQLSSDSGEGYDLADAKAAVDSLDVDWNEEAAESAKAYIEMSGFSCSGLIDQLSSSSGEQFTKAQATYGAKQAGAC